MAKVEEWVEAWWAWVVAEEASNNNKNKHTTHKLKEEEITMEHKDRKKDWILLLINQVAEEAVAPGLPFKEQEQDLDEDDRINLLYIQIIC